MAAVICGCVALSLMPADAANAGLESSGIRSAPHLASVFCDVQATAALAITLSPKPSDGPLNANANTVRIAITLNGPIGRVGGIIKVPGHRPIEVPTRLLTGGRNLVDIVVPAGGVPRGSELRLHVVDGTGAVENAIYTFQ